jgi:Domain of unknown function (DUF5625)
MPTLTIKIAPAGVQSYIKKILALMLLSGCGLFNPTMPVEIPIDLTKAGSVAEAEFWIPEDDALEVIIQFYYQDGPKGRDRLYKLVGRRHEQSGILVPIKVRILKKSSAGRYELFFMDKTYLSTGKDDGGFSSTFVRRSIGTMKIGQGSYRLQVETIKPLPEFTDIPVKFCLYYYRRK